MGKGEALPKHTEGVLHLPKANFTFINKNGDLVETESPLIF